MKKHLQIKINLILIAILFSFTVSAQKVVKEFYDYQKTKVKYQYQVNANGIKNGYYKAFGTKGNLAIEGTYKMNRKNGTWKEYDDYGKVFSIVNYVNDTMNGVYKQWCFEGNNTISYLCGDHIYKKGEKVVSKIYNPKGKLLEEIDIAKNIHNKWFEDGSPETETIDGKTYFYEGVDEGKFVDNIYVDSIGYTYMYHYPYKALNELQIYDKKGECLACIFVEGWRFASIIDGIIVHKKGVKYTEMPLDSASFREGVLLYLSALNPNNKKEKVEYDLNTGDFKSYYNNGDYRIVHYYSDPNNPTLYTDFIKSENKIKYSIEKTPGILTEIHK